MNDKHLPFPREAIVNRHSCVNGNLKGVAVGFGKSGLQPGLAHIKCRRQGAGIGNLHLFGHPGKDLRWFKRVARLVPEHYEG